MFLYETEHIQLLFITMKQIHLHAISFLQSTVSIFLVSIHHKGKARRVAGHPDLPQTAVLLKHTLKITFTGVHI